MPAQVLRGNIILPDRVLERGVVVVEDGVIEGVGGETGARPTLDLGAHYLAPGLIDVHTHGIAGADTMDATHEALSTMARAYAAHGVTGFLATTMTQSMEATLRAVQQARHFQGSQSDNGTVQASLLGLHLEGPWVSREYKGAQNEQYITHPTRDALSAFLDAGSGAIRIVTMAPELPGAEQAIRVLRGHDIYVSIGHSAATYEQVMEAIGWGATQLTHCFNGMTGLHHRQPGIVGAALLNHALYAELIADSVHVHPQVMRLLITVKGRERVMLISDSIAATDLGDGAYALGGQAVQVSAGQARLADGTLAGSTLTLDRAVRNLVQLCGVSLVDAVYMAATVSAEAIRLRERKGRISVGYDADLTILDAGLQPAGVMIGGRLTMF